MEYKDGIVVSSSIADKEEEKKKEHERAWCDLPTELLSLIFTHLCARDRVNVRLICKPYASIDIFGQLLSPPKDSSLSQSPCLMFLDNHFFHPIYNVIYQMDIGKVTLAVIQDSKHGWFLMTQGDLVFFFNPITEVTIQLPDIPDDNCAFSCLCFSSPPTCLDCQVIGFAPVLNGKAEIFTIKRNQGSWSVHKFPQKQEFESSKCNPILYNGIYYCLGREGNLIIYDPKKKKKCYWIRNYDKALRKRLTASYYDTYMLESDGELLVVFIARDASCVDVFRINLSSRMIFERVHNLGNKMLYVSQPACFSETAAMVGGTGNNRIYLPKFHGNDGLFYSLATKKFHSSAGYSTDNFRGVRGYSLCTWIKPIFDTTCVHEFNW